MTNKQQKKPLCVDDLSHAEYYQMQSVFDDLYSKSKNRELFENLMPLMLSRENILLAYHNIKSNGRSKTQGTDNVVIDDIGKLSADKYVEKLRYIVAGSKHGYRPKAVRRKEIPKPNGKLRPLGIPCMWDRLIQQNSVSSKFWSRYVKQNSVRTPTGSARTVPLRLLLRNA